MIKGSDIPDISLVDSLLLCNACLSLSWVTLPFPHLKLAVLLGRRESMQI